MSSAAAAHDTARSRSEIWRLALPASAEAMFQQILGLLGQIMVGGLGEAPFAAVGLAGQILFPIMMVNGAIASGGAILVSQYYGKGERAKVSRVTAQVCLLSLALAIASAGALCLGAPQAFSLMGAERPVIADGVVYLRITSLGVPASLLTTALGLLLQALGDSRSPMIARLIGLGANVSLNYALIFGTRLNAPMGVAGAAWAQVISSFLPAFILAWLMVSSRRLSPLFRGRALLQARWEGVAAIGKLAVPLAGSQVAWTLGCVAHAGLFARLGTSAYAASNVTNTIEVLALMPAHGLSVAGFVMVGHSLGARAQARAREDAGRVVRAGIRASIALSLSLCSSYFFVHAVYPRMEWRTIELARWGLLLCAAALPLKVLNNILMNGVLRAGGDARFIFTVDALAVLVGVPVGWALAYPAGAGFLGVVIGRLTGELVCCGLASYRLRGSTWDHLVAT